MSEIHIRTTFSINDIDAEDWDQLSKDLPFQSHCWYSFGEVVMADCPPVYLLGYDGNALVGRACLWLIRNEPIPKMLGPLKKPAAALFKHWPLLISRSPLSHASGLVLTNKIKQTEIISAFAKAALEVGSRLKASFVLFDYLAKLHTLEWPESFSVVTASDPGTYMENSWSNMDDYLASGNKKFRQHYKRVFREAVNIGIKISQHHQVENMDTAIRLIRSVERRHGALPNPWVEKMLENIDLIDGIFLTASIDSRLVGCGLILEDNSAQMTCALGLAEDIPYVYFNMVYASLELAFKRNTRSLHWGSGAYNVKKHLGFSLEDNNSLVFSATNPYLQKMIKWSF